MEETASCQRSRHNKEFRERTVMLSGYLGRIRDFCLLSAIRSQLNGQSIAQPGNKLFALCTPRHAAHILLQHRSVGSLDQLPLLQVRQQQLAVHENDGEEHRKLRRWIGYQGPDTDTVRSQLKSRVLVPL